MRMRKKSPSTTTVVASISVPMGRRTARALRPPRLLRFSPGPEGACGVSLTSAPALPLRAGVRQGAGRHHGAWLQGPLAAHHHAISLLEPGEDLHLSVPPLSQPDLARLHLAAAVGLSTRHHEDAPLSRSPGAAPIPLALTDHERG